MHVSRYRPPYTCTNIMYTNAYACMHTHKNYKDHEHTLAPHINLQAIKLFIVTSATKGVVTTPLRFSVRFKILYRVIQRLIQHCLLHEMVYLNIIYIIATRNYEFFTKGILP